MWLATSILLLISNDQVLAQQCFNNKTSQQWRLQVAGHNGSTSAINGHRDDVIVNMMIAGSADKYKSPTNRTPRDSAFRGPDKEQGKPREGGLLEDIQSKIRIDLRKTMRSAQNSNNDSDVIRPKSSHTPPRERPARPLFESDARKAFHAPCETNKSTAFVNSLHSCHSNDVLHLREYVDAVGNGDMDTFQRGIELCRIDPNFCSTDGFNALFAAR